MKDASKLVLFIIMAMSIVSLIISMPTLIVAILMGIKYFALRIIFTDFLSLFHKHEIFSRISSFHAVFQFSIS